MSQTMRILQPALKIPTNVMLTGKGISPIVVNGETFLRCPIEDYAHQGQAPSSVQPGRQSMGSLTGLVNPSNNDTLTFTFPDASTRVYTFKTAGAAGANQLNIAQNLAGTMAALAALIAADATVANKLTVLGVAGNVINLAIGSLYKGAAGNVALMAQSNVADFAFVQFSSGIYGFQDYVDVFQGANGLNEIQKIVPSGVPASGTFQLQLFGRPSLLSQVLPFNASNAAIQAAIQQLMNPYNNGPITTQVTGSIIDAVNGISVQYVAPYAGLMPIPLIAVVNNSVQTAAPAAVAFVATETQAGVAPSSEAGPDLDLNGVYQLNTAYGYTDLAGNLLVQLKPVESVRNMHQ